MSTKEIKKTAYEKLGGSFFADSFVYLSLSIRVAFTIISLVLLLHFYLNQILILRHSNMLYAVVTILGILINLQLPYAPFFFSLDRKTLMMSDNDKNYDFNDMFYYYINDLGSILLLHLLRFIYLIFWVFTIIGPFIKFFSYSMASFIKIDHPDWSANDCITESRRIMVDNKFNLFYLYLTFIGWMLISLLTLGAIYPFVRSYIQMSKVEFYKSIKNHYPEGSDETNDNGINENLSKTTDYNHKPLTNKVTLFIITIVLSISTNIALNYLNMKMRRDYYKKFVDINVIERDNIIDKIFFIEIEKDGKTSKQFALRLY